MKLEVKNYKLTGADSYMKLAFILGAVGLIGCVIGYFVNSERFFHSYLTAFGFWTTLGLGALFFTMLHHLTGATWSVIIRRIPESLVAVLPYMAIFFIPVIFGLKELYHWSIPEVVANDHLLQAKSGYLNSIFFVIRTAAYFTVWIVLARFLLKYSSLQDSQDGQTMVEKLRKVSAPGMVFYALSVTYAGYDWFMSLDAHWYSTIFGVYIFGGGLLCALAFFSYFLIFLRKRDILSKEVSFEHYHDLGKLLFAFMIFWAYVAFSQYFLIWYANIPEETIWFSHRYGGGWKYFTWILIYGHFIIPFVVLISRGPKRNLKIMKIMAGWLLVMHWVDLYWITLPNLDHHHAMISWMDITAMLGIGGIFMGIFWKKFSKNPIVPVGDPRLDESIKFVN